MQFYDFYELMCDNFQKEQFFFAVALSRKTDCCTAALAPMTRTRQARLDRNNCIECLTARLAASSHLAHIIFPTRNLFLLKKQKKSQSIQIRRSRHRAEKGEETEIALWRRRRSTSAPHFFFGGDFRCFLRAATASRSFKFQFSRFLLMACSRLGRIFELAVIFTGNIHNAMKNSEQEESVSNSVENEIMPF